MFSDFVSAPLALFGTLGTTEILICAGVFLLLFGSTRLPSLMRNMGRSINEFKAGMQDKPGQTKINGVDEGKKED